jgi:hypothetical protein
VRNVYRKTRGRPTALEEALANYEALEAVRKKLRALEKIGKWKSESVEAAIKFIRELYSLSPPGYSDYEKGVDPLNWRLLGTQVFEHRLDPGQLLPPVEGLLKEIPGVVLQKTPIPTWTTYRTRLADLLSWCPSLHEVEKVLRHLGLKEFPDRGKGAHRVWKDQNNRSFPLPRRDPVSIKVFQSLLRFLGWDKGKYHQFRATL